MFVDSPLSVHRDGRKCHSSMNRDPLTCADSKRYPDALLPIRGSIVRRLHQTTLALNTSERKYLKSNPELIQYCVRIPGISGSACCRDNGSPEFICFFSDLICGAGFVCAFCKRRALYNPLLNNAVAAQGDSEQRPRIQGCFPPCALILYKGDV